MRLDPGYTKLTQKDIYELNRASECIAGAANTIQQLRPQWAPAVVQLLVDANDVVVRIHDRGAASIARYIQKKYPPKVPTPTEVECVDAETGQEQSIEREEG